MFQRVVVVAGMHRGGTSASAASLRALGVEFGSMLMPATRDNKTGYWEDLEIKRLNVELLHRLGSAWYRSGVPSPARLFTHDVAPFRLRAIRLLRKRLANGRPFGIKDPRMARLLPFWCDAFAAAEAAPSFLIPLRDPQSVARSLFQRDRLEPQVCHRLWLEHMTAAEMESRGFARVVVNFDSLIEETEAQVRRIARFLDLPVDEDHLSAFRDRVIDRGLVHSRFRDRDPPAAESVPVEVQAAYERLASMAKADTPDCLRAPGGATDSGVKPADRGGESGAVPRVEPAGVLAFRNQVAARTGALRGALSARVELLKASPGPVGLVLNKVVRPLVRAHRRLFGRNDFNDDVRRVNRPRTHTD